MGRRKSDASRPEISDRVKAMVERAKAHVGGGGNKPIATPARSSTPPPVVAEQASTPLATPPAKLAGYSPAPMSTESPLVVQAAKRL